MNIQLKYGNKQIDLSLDDHTDVTFVSPNYSDIPLLENIEINFSPLHESIKSKNKNPKFLKVGIAINDKTRPVPYPKLIPVLIEELIHIGIQTNNISFFVANGTHVPDYDLSYLSLSKNITHNYCYQQHDSRNSGNLIELGRTQYDNPVLINRLFFEQDIKISIGNIEPHHFAGYSGGSKTVSIGLAGYETITRNHKLLLDPYSVACEYNKNQVRQEIEEIGDLVGLDLSLNCIQTSDLKIMKIFFDKPRIVMEEAIPFINQIYTTEINNKFDIVIASAGGNPKDINFYQAQKACSNAEKLLNENGKLLLIAECREGVGSSQYLNYVKNFSNPEDVIKNFKESPFVIGNHKAYLMAKIQIRNDVYLFSNLSNEIVKQLLIRPIENPQNFISEMVPSTKARVAIMPNAVTTIPMIREIDYE
jgi:nickel-dependent lactate racemase